MTRLPDLLHRAGLAVLLGLGGAFAADAQPACPGLDARLDRLTEGLDLRADQRAALDAIADRYAEADRADLWTAAAEVASALSADQIDQLQQAARARRGERQGSRGERPRMRREREGMRRPRDERGPRLSDDQREALREIRDDVRTRTEALVDQLREGATGDEEFVARARALREEGVRRGAEVLPTEAAERMAEVQTRREAARAARERALRLTEAQKAQLQAQRLDRIRQAPERPDMRPYLDEDGRLDREAFRDAMRERMEGAREARAEAADVLTEGQQDVAFLHRALAGGERGMRGPRRAGRGGRMGR